MPYALLALAIGAFGIGTTEFVTMGILPDVASALGVSIPTAGHLISSYAIGVVIGAPLLTVAATRVPRKTLLLGLMAVFTAGNLASALAPTYEVLLASRVLSGLPHGAFFGVAAVVGAGLVPFDRRARAIALIMSGLTIANIIGVPLGTLAAQQLGWRAAFVIVVAVGLAALAAIAVSVPSQHTAGRAGVRAEMGALGRTQVWLALLTGAVGFGGMFAFYSYITPMMTELSGFAPSSVTLILAVYGLGMTAGNFLGGRLADWRLLPSLYTAIAAMAATLLAMYYAVSVPYLAVPGVFLLALAGSTAVPILQTRLLDVAADAPSLVSSLHHSAFNIANANGAWLGGLVIGAGYGLAAPNLVGAGLAAAGLGLAVAAGTLGRRPAAAPAPVRAAPDADREPVGARH
ncbi:DHA1 family inner membrane transport protein [Murinocardiopsis flavida]|uniref:DHA1 family inner membrane transport protein n=1 Tax=Murinocardiopsis flavida TaxID=645275 RepID=A0A2P8D936_9ACTN|nr:MFS transporter [Murinocardiopsis flavida]PSK93736.1 DHA1 family inner membrane transport protein [Murinocardiopsis flavida]